MFSKILNLCFGYRKLEEIRHNIDIPIDATHMLIIDSEKEIIGRKYTSIYKYNTIYLDNLVLPYDDYNDVVYDNFCSVFDNISLGEFINLVIPNQELEIKYIPLNDYMANNIKPVVTEYTSIDDGYMCKCKNNSYNCVYHKFLIENLYKKYKNDVLTKSSSNCNFYDYDRGMD